MPYNAKSVVLMVQESVIMLKTMESLKNVLQKSKLVGTN